MLDVHATTLDGAVSIIKCPTNACIVDIHRRIDKKNGHNKYETRLLYRGSVLDDNTMTLEDLESMGSISVSVIQRLRGGTMLAFKIGNEKNCSFEVSKNDKIIDVKKKLHEKIGIEPRLQKMVFGGNILDDDKCIQDYNLDDNSIIHVVIRKANEFQIMVMTIDKRSVAVVVTDTDTILDLKAKIQVKLAANPEDQTLIHNGIVVNDDDTLDKCNIKENSVVNFVVKLRGGPKMSKKLSVSQQQDP